MESPAREKRKNILARAWWDFSTCGRPGDAQTPFMRRMRFLNAFSFITVVALFSFGLVNIFTMNLTNGIFEISFALVAVCAIIYFRYSRNLWLSETIVLTLLVLIMSFLFFRGGMEGTGIFWWFCAPAGAFFTKGRKEGWAWVLFLVAEALIGLALQGLGVIRLPYDWIFLRQFLATYLVVSILVYFYETIRHDYEKLIESKTAEVMDTNVQLNAEIEERQKAEEALVVARMDAERANHAKSEFLSRMSHELRTPMNSILGFAQLMESDDREPLPVPHRESLQHILRGGRHLLGLINEVLDLARIESGRMTLSPEPVPVAPFVRDALSMIRPLAQTHRVRITNRIEESPIVRIQADPNRLKQILLNLLSNAVKYNREGGLVTVEAFERGDGRLRLSVTDTGPGIAADQQALIFEPFHRLGADKLPIEGSGIGLTISRKLTEAMGGSLGLTSTPGLGSCFYIDLPLSTPSNESAAPAVLPSEIPAPNPAAQESTVLYIEDDLANLTLVQHILSRRPGIRLYSAPQGTLGLDLARTHHPNLILLDIHLPDLNGRQVFQKLQEDPATRASPVVVVSASAMPSEINAMLQAGAARYLTKPLDIPLFLQTLDSFLSRSREVTP
jgi:signal transduction histidine kinase/CheY-like chemotaxis protein